MSLYLYVLDLQLLADVPVSSAQYVMHTDTVDNVEHASSNYSDASYDLSSE